MSSPTSPPRAATSTAMVSLLSIAPLLAVGLAATVVVLGWLVGARPFWPTPDLTLSEAAATRDSGEVVRLIEIEGQDPNAAWPVRSGLADGDGMVVTPLEAAVIVRRVEMVRLLLRHGAVVPEGPAGMALVCLAAEQAAAEILPLLESAGAPRVDRDRCAPQEARAR